MEEQKCKNKKNEAKENETHVGILDQRINRTKGM